MSSHRAAVSSWLRSTAWYRSPSWMAVGTSNTTARTIATTRLDGPASVLVDTAARHAGDPLRQDRQPRPRDEDRHEVVAIDHRVDVRGGEEACERQRRARQERVARSAEGRDDEGQRQEDRQGTEGIDGPRDQIGGLRRQVAEGPDKAATELLGQRDVPEPVPCVGSAVDDRGTERTGAQRELEVDEYDREDRRSDAPEDQPGSAKDLAIDRRRHRGRSAGRARASASGCRPPARRRSRPRRASGPGGRLPRPPAAGTGWRPAPGGARALPRACRSSRRCR